MSIKGIDAQHMVTRTSEFMKDSSAQLKKNEMVHDNLAGQLRATEQQERQTVVKTAESEMNRLLADQNGRGTGGGSSSSRKRGETEEEDENAEKNRRIMAQLRDTNSLMIDIKI